MELKIELYPPEEKIELYPTEKIELYPTEKIELYPTEKIEETEPLIAFHDNEQIEYVNRNGDIISITKKDVSWGWRDILNKCCIL